MRRRYKTKLKLVTDVQLTSFMDISFLLLIVFLITAPVLEYGTDVTPPRMNAKPLDADKSRIVTLNAKGRIIFDKQETALPDLERALRLLVERTPELVVLVRADQGRDYGQVIELLKAVNKAGVKSVSLVTEAEDL
ncbi:MAG: biopolymer transporter ExbD [Lentisphaeria bacterium]